MEGDYPGFRYSNGKGVPARIHATAPPIQGDMSLLPMLGSGLSVKRANFRDCYCAFEHSVANEDAVAKE
jgi:hypothetical protein